MADKMFAKKILSIRSPKLRLLRRLTSTVFIANVLQWDPVFGAIKELPRYKCTYGKPAPAFSIQVIEIYRYCVKHLRLSENKQN